MTWIRVHYWLHPWTRFIIYNDTMSKTWHLVIDTSYNNLRLIALGARGGTKSFDAFKWRFIPNLDGIITPWDLCWKLCWTKPSIVNCYGKTHDEFPTVWNEKYNITPELLIYSFAAVSDPLDNCALIQTIKTEANSLNPCVKGRRWKDLTFSKCLIENDNCIGQTFE